MCVSAEGRAPSGDISLNRTDEINTLNWEDRTLHFETIEKRHEEAGAISGGGNGQGRKQKSTHKTQFNHH